MARYDREFLVPYLEDICALELSKQKIGNMIEASKKEIDVIEKTALRKVEAPKLEAYKTDEDGTGCGASVFGCVCGLAGVGFFLFGSFSGIVERLVWSLMLIGLAIYLLFCSSNAKDSENAQIRERNNEKEQEYAISQLAALTVVEPELNAIKARINTLKGEMENKVDALLEQQYSINVIPGWYRNLYSAVYLYDWFSNSRADDLDVALNTLVLEQIKDRLDTIIRNQGDMIINQRIMIANQVQMMEQAEKHHAALMEKLNRIEISNEERNMYLSMIESNTAANAYFAAAHYLK